MIIVVIVKWEMITNQALFNYALKKQKNGKLKGA